MNKDYITLDKAYQILNQKLFKHKLPKCNLLFCWGNTNTGAAFSPHHFGTNYFKNDLDTIKMNLNLLYIKSIEEILSYLVHEMVHLWQHHFGKSKTKYELSHDYEWANKMESIGLIPSDTGQEGGRKTGNKMNNYIDKTGKFYKVAKAIIKKYKYYE